MKQFITVKGNTVVPFLLLFIPLHAQQIKFFIHGGAGNISKSRIPDSIADQYKIKHREGKRTVTGRSRIYF